MGNASGAHDFHRPGADAFRHYLSHAEQRHAEPLQLQHGSDRHAGNVHPEPDRRPDALNLDSALALDLTSLTIDLITVGEHILADNIDWDSC